MSNFARQKQAHLSNQILNNPFDYLCTSTTGSAGITTAAKRLNLRLNSVVSPIAVTTRCINYPSWVNVVRHRWIVYCTASRVSWRFVSPLYVKSLFKLQDHCLFILLAGLLCEAFESAVRSNIFFRPLFANIVFILLLVNETNINCERLNKEFNED